MRRAAELQQLSREHHSALVLALRIERAAPGTPARDAVRRALPELFRDQLEPHFAAEEGDVLPRLARAGEFALVERTLDEHDQLCRLAAPAAGGDEAALDAFAALLRAHVRFEESQLFPAAERLLPEAP